MKRRAELQGGKQRVNKEDALHDHAQHLAESILFLFLVSLSESLTRDGAFDARRVQLMDDTLVLHRVTCADLSRRFRAVPQKMVRMGHQLHWAVPVLLTSLLVPLALGICVLWIGQGPPFGESAEAPRQV